MNRLVAIVGPTGSGKSKLALRLAQELDGEIIGADSRQVYRHLDIGTAKPSQQEMAIVRHHLVDIINPDDDFSLAQYQQLAGQSVTDIQRRAKLALLVGGSGLYVWSTVEGWQIPRVPPDLQLRHQLQERAVKGGADELYNELVVIDPEAAGKIDRRNVRRIIRAIEVHQHAEIPFSQLQQKTKPAFSVLVIGLTADRAELYRRVDLRVDGMMEQGLVDEVERLVNMGYGFHLPAMSGIGYQQIGMHLKGELTLAAAIQQMKYETHRFVRQQYNWFRLKDDRIHWFDIGAEIDSEITALVAGFISG